MSKSASAKSRKVFVPTAFSPNGDQNNDLLLIHGQSTARVLDFRVYDRWGSCLFEGLDLAPNDPAQGWAGRYKGQDVSPGVYVYVVDLEYADGTTEVRGGDVTVVR